MAKDQNTYAKRAREHDKKLKADAKRERRRRKKEQADQPVITDSIDDVDNAEREDIEP